MSEPVCIYCGGIIGQTCFDPQGHQIAAESADYRRDNPWYTPQAGFTRGCNNPTKGNMPMELKIQVAGVKVMRSYDYCHFEVTLSSTVNDLPEGEDRFKAVDELRKQAARLADKAVEQYKIAKRWAAKTECQGGEREKREALAQIILETPEYERTPEEQGILKGLADERYAKRHYDYQDDWDDSDY